MSDVADFLVRTGLSANGYVFINTDEGWELKQRDATGKLQWSPEAFPSTLPTFIKKLHRMGLKFGIYGAASGVTCGVNPGHLYNERLDMETFAAWGVDYVKSDNCASYALDPSVRFAAQRDAIAATTRPMILSIEPFSITPDPEQSRNVAHLWRVACDICSTFACVLDRADISDKWAPLAGPNNWNDPDMIHLQNPPALSLGENRVYFGLWALMKSPLLLSSNLTALRADVLSIANNTAVIAVNQDPLGVQARKLAVDGAALPWLVGLDGCGTQPRESFSRAWTGQPQSDNKRWHVDPASTPGTYTIRHEVTGRCLGVSSNTTRRPVDLMPCDPKAETQHWRFDKGLTTVTSVTNVASGLALAVGNGTLTAGACGPLCRSHDPINTSRANVDVHGSDGFAVSDVAYGHTGLTLAKPYDQPNCDSRDCQNYDPSQMWYYSATDGYLRQSTYVASINHRDVGEGYTLTNKVPTWRHHCLAHVLSEGNQGTDAGTLEVWGGPLQGGGFVLGLLNRGGTARDVTATFSMLEVDNVGEDTTFHVTSLFSGQDLGLQKGRVAVEVDSHDLVMLRLVRPSYE